MSKLVWDQQGEKQYELGVDHVVLYKKDPTTKKWMGTAWNGCTSISDSPEGADETELWADNIKYGSLRSAEKHSGSIEAYTYPEEWEECDGMARPVVGLTIGQQKRVPFCLCYRTKIGNDEDSEAGYKLHIIYNATASPSEKSYETVNDSPDAITFSWDYETTPVAVTGYKPTSCIVIDSTDFMTDDQKNHLKDLEDQLYGTDDVEEEGGTTKQGTAAELPMPDKVISIITNGKS